jgi:hypothetical protein
MLTIYPIVTVRFIVRVKNSSANFGRNANIDVFIRETNNKIFFVLLYIRQIIVKRIWINSSLSTLMICVFIKRGIASGELTMYVGIFNEISSTLPAR